MKMDISVIICTFNRSESLQDALRSLEEMLVPPDLLWEVVVVDNNSTDDTLTVVRRFACSSSLNVRYVFEPVQGLSHARNSGIREAKGAILSFMDDDVIVAEDWIVRVKEAFIRYQVACVGGKVPLRPNLRKPDWWHEDYDCALGPWDKGEQAIIADANLSDMVCIGANLSFKRSSFEKYGGFQPGLGRIGASLLMGEEAEFCNRLRNNGELIVYYPQAIVYQSPTPDRMTMRYVRRWFFRIGEWFYLHDVFSKINSTHHIKLIVGVPRWRYRAGIKHFVYSVFQYLTGSRNEAFYNFVQFNTFLGYLFGRMKHRMHKELKEDRAKAENMIIAVEDGNQAPCRRAF